MYKKIVIVFEGIESSGKTSHSQFVSRYLKKKKINHLLFREPGGSINSEKIRKLLLQNSSNFDKKTDLLLYLASRNENIKKLRNHYKKKIILIDRFVDSTIAYQHFGQGISLPLIKNINKHIIGNFKVNFTFLNIVSKKNMILRLKKRKKLNRYDKFNSSFYQKVQNGFIKIAKKDKKKYQIINSNKDIKFNKEIIINKINKLIK
tara:strand:+ start:653 stop:1267 length:615 start_codon:yes stop_codon:yes gene_type:complete